MSARSARKFRCYYVLDRLTITVYCVWMGYTTMFRRTIGPTHHWSDAPLFRRTIGPTHHGVNCRNIGASEHRGVTHWIGGRGAYWIHCVQIQLICFMCDTALLALLPGSPIYSTVPLPNPVVGNYYFVGRNRSKSIYCIYSTIIPMIESVYNEGNCDIA